MRDLALQRSCDSIVQIQLSPIARCEYHRISSDRDNNRQHTLVTPLSKYVGESSVNTSRTVARPRIRDPQHLLLVIARSRNECQPSPSWLHCTSSQP